MVQGLKNGTKYGVRVFDSNMSVIVPLGVNHLAEAKGHVMEGAGQFNLKQEPLSPGSYRMELIRIEYKKFFIVAYINLSIS